MALTLQLHGRIQAYDASLCEGVTEEEMAAFVSATSKIMSNYAALSGSSPR